MTSKLTLLFSSAVLLCVTACGGGSAMAFGDTSPDDPPSFVVEVENNHFADAQVFIRFHGASRRRLGTVTGKSTDAFTVRHSIAAFIFILDFTGGGPTQATQSTTARRGDAFLLRATERQPLILIRR